MYIYNANEKEKDFSGKFNSINYHKMINHKTSRSFARDEYREYICGTRETSTKRMEKVGRKLRRSIISMERENLKTEHAKSELSNRG